jgi:aquaporin-7
MFTTFLLTGFACAAGAQYTFLRQDDKTSFNFLAITISTGIVVSLGIIIGGKISGAHMNPAVSLGMLLTGRLTLIKYFVYVLAQFIGSLIAATFVFCVYYDAIQSYPGGTKTLDTAGIFASYPMSYMSILGSFLDTLTGATFFVLIVLTVSDTKNSHLSLGAASVACGAAITLIGICYGINCGYAINPARDLAPRIFTSMAGWGSLPFTAHHYYFWVPVVAPLCGAVIATLIYSFFISNHWPEY